jgi:hypothetical protein
MDCDSQNPKREAVNGYLERSRVNDTDHIGRAALGRTSNN